jgi:hypothetical protein
MSLIDDLNAIDDYYEELQEDRERRRLQRESELDGYVPPEED